MRSMNLLKLTSAALLTIGVTLTPLSLPASAQVTEPNAYPQEVYENDFDWGWLGLLGLIGLAGLAGGRRKNTDSTAYRDSNREDATAYRDPYR